MSLYAFRNSPEGRSGGLMAGATSAEWTRFLRHTRVTRMQAGDLIVRQGDVARALYIVLSGRLEVVLAEGGSERRLASLESGTIFGEQSFLDAQPRSTTVRCAEPGELRVLEWSAWEQLSASHPELALKVLHGIARTLSERLRRTTHAHRTEGGCGDE